MVHEYHITNVHSLHTDLISHTYSNKKEISILCINTITNGTLEVYVFKNPTDFFFEDLHGA